MLKNSTLPGPSDPDLIVALDYVERNAMAKILGVLMFGSVAAFANPLVTIAQRNAVFTAYTSSAVVEAKIGISFSWITDNRIPRNAAEFGKIGEKIPPRLAPDSGIGALRIDHGTIIVTLGRNVQEALVGKVFALAPCVKGQDVHMTCGRSQCRDGFALAPGALDASALTTLDPAVLPASCR